ncbi:MAG: amidohydrolase [Bacteroidetes bacterium]|nr:amidohydrolase [Bacteroidota bacterium]
MSDLLRISTIQASLEWENIAANLALFSKKMEGLVGQTDIVVLPEMFTTGFSMKPERLAEDMAGQTMRWLAAQARLLNAVVTGSFIAAEAGRYYNRLVWMRPDGTFEVYDKRHLFSPAGEHEAYAQGQKKLVTEWMGWKICPLICYDLRFPVWSRNVENYDLIIYVANWPEQRSHHWQQLLVARAIENQTYTVGVNRCGGDGNGLQYSGDTSVIDFSGKTLNQMTATEAVFTTTLCLKNLQAYRNDLQFLADRDNFEIFVR